MNALRKTVLAALLIACATVTATGHAQIAFRAAASAGAGASTTITHVAAGAGSTSSGCPSSITPSIPAGVNGDILVALVATKDSATLTPSAGWNTFFTQNPVVAFKSAIYWRIATGADALTVSKTGSGCDVLYGRIGRFRGVDSTNPFESGSPVPAANWSYQNSTTITSGTETPTAPNTMLLFAVLIGDNNSTDASGLGFSESFDSGSGTGSDVQVALNYRIEATGGTKGPFSVVKGGGADPNHGVLFALRPAGSTLTINVPAGTTTNDVMVASVTARPCSNTSGAACTLTVTPPAGWTLVNGVDQTTGGASGGFGHRLFVYQKVVVGAEPASYTWLFGGTPVHAGLAGGILAFSGVDTTSPIVASAGQATASATTHAAPSINSGTETNTMLVSAHTANSSAAWAPPAGMNEAVDRASLATPNDLGLAIETNYELRAGAGATGTRTASWTTPPAADTGATHMLALRPVVTINHFSISHSGSGIACVDQTITITAHDASHVAVSANSLTLALSTTNARGTWTGIVSGGGTLSDPTAGDGAATYTFAAGSTSVQLSFRYANLAGNSETFGFNVSGGGFSEATGTANASDDPSFTMAQAGFQFRNLTDGNTTIPTQISGKPSDTGFNAKTVRVQAIRTDTVTGSCTGLFASQTRTVDLGAECNNPTACAGQQASINGTNIATSNDNGAAAAAAYTGVSLTFNASSEADTVIAYPDAGQISLHARHDLDSGVAGFEMVGSSNAFVVRPFGFAFHGANAATAIQHSTTDTGAVLVPAGDNLTMTVAAYGWASGEDANDDGVPDAGVDVTNNGLTPNFAASVAVAPGANLPGVAPGAVSRGVTCTNPATIAAGSFAGGSATVNDWCYSEAGNVFLNATSSNYISAGVNIAGDSGLDGTGAAGGYVGRFRPKYFVISGTPTITNRSAAACAPASAFTYMNEGLDLAFTLVARNTQGATTQNYNGIYAKLGIGTFANFNFGARSGMTNLIARVDSGVNPVGSWSNGVASITATTGIRRATPDNPDGPYTAVQFGIAPVDTDGVAMNTLDFDADGNTVNERANLGVTTEVRFGRLRLTNAFGSALLDLPLPLSTEYYDGSFFVTNTADSCTSLSASDIVFSFLAATPGLIACETHLNPAGVIAFASGKAGVRLTKPGSTNNGAVDLTVNLGAAPAGSTCTSATSSAATAANKTWLRGNWGTGTYTDNPRGRATFGIFKNADQFLYFREVY